MSPQIIAPCKDCDKKGCGLYHTQCEAYLEFRRLKDEENRKRVYVEKSVYSSSRCRKY